MADGLTGAEALLVIASTLIYACALVALASITAPVRRPHVVTHKPLCL